MIELGKEEHFLLDTELLLELLSNIYTETRLSLTLWSLQDIDMIDNYTYLVLTKELCKKQLELGYYISTKPSRNKIKLSIFDRFKILITGKYLGEVFDYTTSENVDFIVHIVKNWEINNLRWD